MPAPGRDHDLDDVLAVILERNGALSVLRNGRLSSELLEDVVGGELLLQRTPTDRRGLRAIHLGAPWPVGVIRAHLVTAVRAGRGAE